MENCDHLDSEGKAKLIKHLLGDSSIQVTIGTSQFHADNVYQFNLSTEDQMANLLMAVAEKIRK